MSNFERDMANTMLDAADARIASLEADKADLLRVLGIADERIRSGEETAVEQVTYVNAIPPCSRCGKRVGLSIPRMGIKEAGDDICVCQAPETLFSSTVNRSSKP